MQNGARVGSTLVVKGEITAQEPLSIAGRVDGTIEAPGQVVTVEHGAMVSADISASGVIVAGEVTGSIAAEARIHLQATAQVDGDLSSPLIAVEDGALVRGSVQVIRQDRAIRVA